MPSCMPSPVSWVLEVRHTSGETVPEKKSPGTALRPGWEMQFTGGKASEPPAGKKIQGAVATQALQGLEELFHIQGQEG